MKKVVSFILAMVMVVSLLPTIAFAEETTSISVGTGNVTQGNTTTVDVSISNSGAFSVLGLSVSFPENSGLSLTDVALSNEATSVGMSIDDSASNYGIGQILINGSNTGSTVPDGVLLTLTVAASSESENGEYAVNLNYADNDPDSALDVSSNNISCSFSAGSITVGSSAPEVTEAYTATLSSTTTTVDNNGTDTVSVNVVVGGTTKSFASTEIKLTYDPTYLTYSSGSCALTPTLESNQADQAVSISADNGVITIRDYGGTMAVAETGTTAYTLVFNTVKGGSTNVSLTSAGFSTLDNAASQNLTYVTDTDTVAVTINHKATVTVDGVAGTTTYVAPDGDYTYQISDYNATNYTYTVTATEGGNEVDASRISIDNTGKVTITDVSDELAVTISKNANSYTITWKDSESAITGDKPDTQNYGTGITFAVKAGEKPADSTKDGYYYSVKAYLTSDSAQTITVSSTETDNYAAKTYTIDANAITDNITIEVTKETVSATQTTININEYYTELSQNGNPLTSNTLNVEKGKSVTLVLNKEDGYTYTVQTKVGDADAQDVTVASDGSFTITVDNEPVTLIITKTLNTESLEVSEYVQLDGKTMWLVKINGLTDTADKTYTYTASEGATAESFCWSDKYTLTDATTDGAYCYLVVTDTNTAADTVKADVADKIGLTNTAAVAISYNGNVNLTTDANGAAVIDVNDAQLVWNMYSAVYSDTSTVSVQKFLEADMDETVGLSTGDAATVVAKIQ